MNELSLELVQEKDIFKKLSLHQFKLSLVHSYLKVVVHTQLKILQLMSSLFHLKTQQEQVIQNLVVIVIQIILFNT